MERKALRSDFLMLIAAAIWGFAFVAQRVGMETMGPHFFNTIRFFIGALALAPVVWFFSKKPKKSDKVDVSTKKLLIAGSLAGLLLFGGAAFQQVGIQYTTAGKAGFITGLYIFFVPLIGLFFGQRTGSGTWLGATMALAGLYLLSFSNGLSLNFENSLELKGDLLELVCAVFFAGHVLIIGYLAKKIDPIKLSIVQFFVAGVLSLLVAVSLELITWDMITATAIPLLYAGVMSTGVAYTLQVVAQQHAHSSHAAIILSLEGAFALLGGWLLLDEQLPARGLLGCGLMLTGMLLSQMMPKIGFSPAKS
ncbi:MAG TPA: DMT family transporter [Candidatus Thioglobus sp.]|jgi:drug/metabolite transporter (DMT)-like permease|nr:DMT family transporter [Candidatus Thioglobus sp.]